MRNVPFKIRFASMRLLRIFSRKGVPRRLLQQYLREANSCGAPKGFNIDPDALELSPSFMGLGARRHATLCRAASKCG